MEFFNIWQTKSGLIGVNRLTLGDLITVNIMVYVIYFILLMLIVQFLPIMLLTFYIVYLFNGRMTDENSAFDTKQRLFVNILSIISVIYFLIDFHLGWASFNSFSSVVSKETFDSFAIFNFSIGLINIFLFFLGHECYKYAKTWLHRLAMFVIIVILGFKIGKPISRYFIHNVITQYNDTELTKVREEMKIEDEYNSDENIQKRKAEREEEEAKTEQRLKEFDKNFARDYLTK
jgi:signal transduction histidine kinase